MLEEAPRRKDGWKAEMEISIKVPCHTLEAALGRQRLLDLTVAGQLVTDEWEYTRFRVDADPILLASVLKLADVKVPNAFKRTLETIIDGERNKQELPPAHPVSEEL